MNSIGVSRRSGSPSIAARSQPARGVDLEALAGPLLPLPRQQPLGRVHVEQALVEALALAEREEVELVRVVRDEDDSGRDRLTVDAQAERTRLPRQQRERAKAGQHGSPPPVVLATVDEPRVDAQGHVVQEQPPVRPADVDPPLRRRRTTRARRAGRLGRDRGHARSGSASRTGSRRMGRPRSMATSATAASDPSPPAIPSGPSGAERAISATSSPSWRTCVVTPRRSASSRSSSALGCSSPARGLMMRKPATRTVSIAVPLSKGAQPWN